MVKLELDQYPAAGYLSFEQDRPDAHHGFIAYKLWLHERFGAHYRSFRLPHNQAIVEQLVFEDERRALEFILKHG